MIAVLLSLSAMAAPATDFSLRDLQNRSMTLSDYRGEVVMMSFWATWCVSCLAELNAVQALYATNAERGLVVLAISLDEARDRSRIRPVGVSHGWTFPILWDQGGKVATIYNPTRSVPYSVVIDQQGEIVLTVQGLSEGTVAEISDTIEGLLSTATPSP
jgi:peroxiredoxin